jgi:hypothetical protein
MMAAAVASMRDPCARVPVMRGLRPRIMRVTAPTAMIMMIAIAAAEYASEHRAGDAQKLRRRWLRLDEGGEWQSKKRDEQEAPRNPPHVLLRRCFIGVIRHFVLIHCSRPDKMNHAKYRSKYKYCVTQ